MSNIVLENRADCEREIREHQVNLQNSSYYCRGLHGVMPKEIQYCRSCPFALHPEQKDISKQSCRYIDYGLDCSGGKQLEEMTPLELFAHYEADILHKGSPAFPCFTMEQGNLLQRAYQFAGMAHKGVKRKGTKIPYLSHVMETAQIVSTMTSDQEVIAAALLHDVVEDTSYTLEDIKDAFGYRVAGFVAAESEDKMSHLPASQTWYLRKKHFLDHIGQQTIEVQMIALADKLSNMRSTARDYKKMGERIWERFNQKDKKLHGWYYLGVSDRLKHLKRYPAWQEYKELCTQVFGENN